MSKFEDPTFLRTSETDNGCNQTPHRPTSTSSAQCFCSLILSPLASVSNLLSSMTEFMLSTHSVSTSPSNKMYLRSFLSVGLLTSRKMFERRPSVQSRVMGSSTPYSSTTVVAFGFNANSFVARPSLYGKGLGSRKNPYCRSGNFYVKNILSFASSAM